VAIYLEAGIGYPDSRTHKPISRPVKDALFAEKSTQLQYPAMSHPDKESRPPERALDGVLVVDKTEGPTSHDVVKLARRALGESRIGHTGTLDPMATGVLPLVIGRATRLAQFLTASDKTYEAVVTFGRTTDTCDALGTVTATSERRPAHDQLVAALEHFRGTYEQTPPAYSAKNIDGERSYNLARKSARQGASPDAAVRPKAVTVTAKRVELLSFDGDSARLEMQVTAGFYVRSLAYDLGEALGCGAHLSALRRTRSGEFGLPPAVPLVDLLQSGRESLAARLVPLSALLPDLPAVMLRGPGNMERLKNGLEIAPLDLIAPIAAPAAIVRVLSPDGDLAALARPGKTPGFLHGWVVLG
jgi:tRNA pseudouridine55 synthase